MAKFDVDVGGATYEVEAPDEKTAWKWANATHNASTQSTDYNKELAQLDKNAESPKLKFAPDALRDFSRGVTTTGRGAINALNKIAPSSIEPFPYSKPSGSGMETLGSLVDPAAWAIGGAVGKALPYAPVLGKGAMQGAKAIGQNTLSGGLAGGAIGALSDSGDAMTGAGIGAVASNVLPPVISAIPRGVLAAKNALYPSTGSLMVKAAGDKTDDVIAALMSAPKGQIPDVNPTVAEAAIPAGSTEFAALQKRAAMTNPSIYYGADKANEAGRLSAIQGIGRDKEALAAAISDRGKTAAENYGAIKGRLVSNKSDIQLMEDAIAERFAAKANALQDQGRFQTMAAQQDSLSKGVPINLSPKQSPNEPYFNVGVTGGRAPTRVDADGSLPKDFPFRMQGQLPERRLTNNFAQSLEAEGAAKEMGWIAKYRQNEERFLRDTFDSLKNTVGMSDVSLNKYLSRPSIQDAIKDAAKSAAEKGIYFPSKAGDKFSVENLQRMKESLDAGIKAAGKSADAGNRPVLSQAELTDTKNAFIKWFSEKVPEWRDSRITYAADSVPINRMQVGQELEKALTKPLGDGERAGVFANAVREAPRTIKKSTGMDRFDDLSQVLAPDQNQTVQNVLGSLSNQATLKDMARHGMPNLENRVAALKLPATGLLQPTITVARNFLNRALGSGVDNAMEKLAPIMLNDPQRAALLMKAASPQQRKVIEGLLSKFGTRGAIVSGGVLSSSDEPKGVLSSY